MKNLLQNLDAYRTDYVHLHREAPFIRLQRKGPGSVAQTCLLQDVGADFIEIGIPGGKNRQLVSRDQIADVLILPREGK